MGGMARIVIVGGGPGGYEAALVAAQLGARVTVVDRDGLGGGCVLDDCVPSKTLISTSELMGMMEGAPALGVLSAGAPDSGAAGVCADMSRVNARVKGLARAQSEDVETRLQSAGIEVVRGDGELTGAGSVRIGSRELPADVVLVATGGRPRVLPDAEPDGKRILTWRQMYDLEELPEELVVVGSGVTGVEFANAYQALGSRVTLVSSRDRVLPHEDPEAAAVLEDVFARRGIRIVGRSRAAAVHRTGEPAGTFGDDSGVVVTLTDGRTVTGTHCLLTVGVAPNTQDIGLAEVGVRVSEGGFIEVDRVSRTSAPGVYAAGDCTGVMMLASVAAMQGRVAMWHALGEAVQPLRQSSIAATVFTHPEIATVGVAQHRIDRGEVPAREVKLSLATNPRAKMGELGEGFVKLFCRPGTGIVLRGEVVAPRASELILPISLAVQHSLTVEQLAHTFSVYPSLSGSLTEAARQLMVLSEP